MFGAVEWPLSENMRQDLARSRGGDAPDAAGFPREPANPIGGANTKGRS